MILCEKLARLPLIVYLEAVFILNAGMADGSGR
jgi:hypothetical protein